MNEVTVIRRCEACECPIPDGYPSYWADTQMCASCAVSLVAEERDDLVKQLQGAVDDLAIAAMLLAHGRGPDSPTSTEDKALWYRKRDRLIRKWGR